MIKTNNCGDESEMDNKKNNELIVINNNISSDKMSIINIRNKDSNLILESFNDTKIKNYTKQKLKNTKKQYKSISNYSFSNKTSGNELSKIHFESLEKETLDFDEELNKNSIKKDIPIYINHSDYFYCPNSMKEKNLNIQIIKYLAQNNLIKNRENIVKMKKNCNNNHKIKKDNSFKIEKGINIQFDNNPINFKIENDIIKDNNESIFLNAYNKGNYEYNKKRNLFSKEQKNNYNQDNFKQFENNKINNINIQYINNIKNNKKIYTIEHINNIDKPKENFYTFRTGKIIEDNKLIDNAKLSRNNNFISDSSSTPKKLIYDKIKRNKIKKKKNFIPISSNKKKIIKNNSKMNYKENKSNYFINNYIKEEYKISSKVVNIKIIVDNKNKRSNSCDISVITLQSINDSKILELADNFIPKDEELEKFRANEIITKRNKLTKKH